MEQLAKLYKLQLLEKEVSLIEEQMNESEQSVRKKRAERAVALHDKELSTLEKNLSAQRQVLRAMDDQLASLETEIAQVEEQLFSGQVRNPKELAALQGNLEATKQRKSQLEDSVLDEMERVESWMTQIDDARKLASQLDQTFREALHSWKEAQAARSARLEEGRSECEALRQEVNADLLNVYDSLRKRMSFSVVAKVNDRTCSGCRVELPTSVKAVEGGRCPHCDRLLWWS